MLGDGEYLVAGIFHCAGLVHGNVAGGGRHNALEIPEHGGYDGGIGLGAAGKEEDLGPGTADGFADAGLGRSRKTVCPISGLLDEIGGNQALQDGRMRALVVIAGKGNHSLKACYKFYGAVVAPEYFVMDFGRDDGVFQGLRYHKIVYTPAHIPFAGIHAVAPP